MISRAALAAALVAAALARPAAPQTAATAEAFARHDFAAAAERWRAEAGAGSTEAKFGLGLVNDLGLGMPRDAAKALRWYLEAAEEGLPQAQFNVGVMLDAGTGVPRNPVVGAVWYARAAANGHHRGEYDLGLLYERGEGVPRNADLARYWLGRAAASLPAAGERLAALAPVELSERRLAAPVPAVAAIVPDGDAARAELVWTAAPGPLGARYLVELALLPTGEERSGALVISEATEASAIAATLPAAPERYAWRVSLVDLAEARYRASPWQPVGTGAEGDPRAGIPEGRVTLRAGADDKPAQWLAEELAESFREAGLWVRIASGGRAPQESGVRYAFIDDAELATTIAEFLPVLHGNDAELARGLELAPGEVEVRLVGGPAQPEP